MPELSFYLNGESRKVEYEEGMNLLDVLRDECGVTSPKDGCAPQGACGCCTVMVEGRAVLSCLRKPESVEGASVTTLEGVPDGQRRVLAEAFVREGGLQCGYCTPGIAARVVSLLDRTPDVNEEQVRKALNGHICRCTGYQRIVDAVLTAADAWEDGALSEGRDPRRADVFGASRGLRRASPTDGDGVGGNGLRYRGDEQTLGDKPYVADMSVGGMLHGAVVLSRHPRAVVLEIDPLAVLEMPGVERVLVAEDVPGNRLVGLIRQDWPVFVAQGETTRCVGDVLALVLADTRFHARLAAEALEALVRYEVLEPVVDPVEALGSGSPAVHESGNLLDTCAYARGDVDTALAESAHVVERSFETQRIEHAFLEPEACLAVPVDASPESEDGPGAGARLKIFTQGQGVHDDQAQVASVLGIEPRAVEVELVSNGGAFGGKEDLSIQAQTALATFLTGRAVRTVLTREQSLRMHPKRHPITLHYQAGADAGGRLTGIRARIIGDTGAYASVGMK
ncbi:MAG: molybdopterin cofactor-binding domain-containing protein, partial [Gemmatimonadota bacterium]